MRRAISLTLMALGLGVGCGVDPGPAERQAPEPPLIQVGDEATLHLPGGQGVWLAADDQSFDEMLEAENAGSLPLLTRLMARGTVIREPNGARVLVVKRGFASLFVRILYGENPGFEGWIQSEFVRKPIETHRNPQIPPDHAPTVATPEKPEPPPDPPMSRREEPAEPPRPNLDRANVRLRMALALERVNPSGALGYYREVARDFPGTDQAKEAEARIRALAKTPSGNPNR